MTTSRRVFNGALTLGVGQIASQGLSFARNVIVARLLSPADFGIAVTFAMTVSLFDIASNFDPAILLIQSPDGGERRFEDTAHAMEIMRGLMNCALLAAIAWPTAALFGIPQARGAFLALALDPLLRASGHLDRMRVQRDLNYRLFVTVEVCTHVTMLALAWPLCTWFRDYRAMLCLLIGQSAVISLVSHIVAQRPYRWAWDKQYFARFISFGWPLLINGIVIFSIGQGDRAVVAMRFTMTDLGVYSVAMTLATMPTTLVFRVVGPLLLPLMSRVQEQRIEFLRRYNMTILGLCAIGICITVPLIVAGGSVVRLVFGARYSGAGVLIVWLAAAQAIKFVRGAPITATMARGDTHNQMLSNLWRISGVAAATTVALTGGSLVLIAGCSLFGEIVALLASLWRLERHHDVPANIGLKAAIFSGAVCAIATVATVVTPFSSSIFVAIPLAAVTTAMAIVAMFLLFAEFRCICGSAQALVLQWYAAGTGS